MQFSQKIFRNFITEWGAGGSRWSGANFVEKKSVHVIAKHRREKFVDSKNSMQKCAIYISPKWCVSVGWGRSPRALIFGVTPPHQARQRTCGGRHDGDLRSAPRSTDGAQTTPFYPMKIAAGRRPAGDTALRWFPLWKFRPKTFAPCARSTTVNPGAKLRILAKAPGPEETNKKRT